MHVGMFEILTEVLLKIEVLLDVTLHHKANSLHCFEWPVCLHHDPEDEGTTIHQNVEKYLPSNCVSHPSDLKIQEACCE
jgi:hypothetical protein